jgi:3-dehydroquinate dehydratase-2
MKAIYLLNGPNLNMLGKRDPDIYGRETLAEIEALCRAEATKAGYTMECRQTNHEGVLIDWVQEAAEKAAAIIINPGGYSHTSIALMDALEIAVGAGVLVVEVHLSDIHAREEFRRHSYVSRVASAVIMGKKAAGYGEAVGAAINLAQNAKKA